MSAAVIDHASDAPSGQTAQRRACERRTTLVAVAALVLAFLPLYLRGLDRPLGNGDEAVYAELARSMAEGGDWLTPRWQGRPVFNRPPASLWPLALTMKVAGTGEAVVHAAGAVEATAIVVLVFLLGSLLWTRPLGIVAALLCGTSSLQLLYARTVVADSLLVIFGLASFVAWELGRKRKGWLVVWGVALALALLTKQVVGLLPLAAPVADLLCRRRWDRRGFVLGLGIGIGLWTAWLGIETSRFGVTFLHDHLLANVFERARTPMLEKTAPWFYLQMLLALETPLALLSVLGMVLLIARREYLVPLWGMGTLLVFSVAATRFNYYALVAYPALALATATALLRAAALPVRAVVALPWVTLAVWIAVHVPMPGFLRPLAPMDPEPGWLAQQMKGISRAEDPLFLVGLNPYSARYYSKRRTIQLVARRAATVSTAVLEAERWPADDVSTVLREQARWFAIVRKDQIALLRALGTVRLIGQTPALALVTNLDHAEARAP